MGGISGDPPREPDLPLDLKSHPPPTSPVSGTIHGLEGEGLVFHGEGEHALAVMFPVTGHFPEFGIENVGGDDFGEAALKVLALETKGPV